MNLSNNTVLITGGGSGIGLGLAQRLIAAGSEVIICGRRKSVLEEAKIMVPSLHTYVCDVADEQERTTLLEWAVREFPNLNVLVNNAGIQRHVQLTQPESWNETRQEIAINLEAPIHLSRIFTPHLQSKAKAAIINVTSGLSFAPLANVPVYCATKAALHSFTLSLRYQLAATSIEVIEVIPPAVNTDLGGPGLHTFGEPLDAFSDAVIEGLQRGDAEIAYGSAIMRRNASREELDEYMEKMNAQFNS